MIIQPYLSIQTYSEKIAWARSLAAVIRGCSKEGSAVKLDMIVQLVEKVRIAGSQRQPPPRPEPADIFESVIFSRTNHTDSIEISGNPIHQ